MSVHGSHVGTHANMTLDVNYQQATNKSTNKPSQCSAPDVQLAHAWYRRKSSFTALCEAEVLVVVCARARRRGISFLP